MKEDLGRTLVEGPDLKSARKGIEDTLNKLESRGADLETLINSRKELGKLADWRNVSEGDAILHNARKSFTKAIDDINPAIGKRLKENDAAWSKYKKLSKDLHKPKMISIKGLQVPAENIAFVAAPLLHIASGGTALKVYAAKEAVQRLSTSMILNPRLDSLRKRMVQSMLNGENVNKYGALIAKVLKEDEPDLYEELTSSKKD